MHALINDGETSAGFDSGFSLKKKKNLDAVCKPHEDENIGN